MFIEPPESHVLTDEDSADEDDRGLADNLSSRQLTALAKIRFANSRRIGGIALNTDLRGEITSNGDSKEENLGNPSTSNTSGTGP